MPVRTTLTSLGALALLLVASPAAAQAPPSGDMAALPPADQFDIRYYLTDEDGRRVRLMSQLYLDQFYNRARCECGHLISSTVRLKRTSGMTYDNTQQIQGFIGVVCAMAEVTPFGQFRPCAQFAATTVQTYYNGVDTTFHPVWLTQGVDLSDNDSRSPTTATAAGSCSADVQGESGVWMCTPNTNGVQNCQSEEFFISGTQNNNVESMSGGIKYDFIPPTTEIEGLSAVSGDEAVVLKWNLPNGAGDGYGYRVLCEEADTGKPPEGLGLGTPSLNQLPQGQIYFTKDNLCPDGPFNTVKLGDDSPLVTATMTDTATATATATATDTLTTDDTSTDTDGDTEDTGGADPDLCGNGVVDPGEECDLGKDDNADDGECNTKCIRQYCGDGVVIAPEECDDGNLIQTDLCTNTCKNAACGDRIVSPENVETCDLGPRNGDPRVLCDDECQEIKATCPNDVKEPGEGCDGEDGCLNCKPPNCGVGDPPMQDGYEDCDGGPPNCTVQCTVSECGDGLITPPEECDEGADNSDARECTSDCRLSSCGDGKILTDADNAAILEECDDGDQNGDSKPCLTTCKRSACGDAKVGPGEQCDLGMGNNLDTAACRSDCQENVCGDGFVGPGEECDAGKDNADNGLCKTDCKFQGSDGLRNLDWDYLCSGHLAASTTTARISGLKNNTRYNFILVPYDRFGNPRAVTTILTAAPVNTRDLWEQCKYQGDVCGESGFCNVAGGGDPLLGLGSLFGLGFGFAGLRRRRSRQRTCA